jgi:hypothetical protein
MTSDSSIDVSDRYIDLENVKEEIQKSPRSSSILVTPDLWT